MAEKADVPAPARCKVHDVPAAFLKHSAANNDVRRRGAITALKHSVNGAFEIGKIKKNPLGGVKKPPVRAGERFLTREELQTIFDNYRGCDCFWDFLFAIENTGCRPGRGPLVTADQSESRTGV